jgi:hypothetical protein
MSFFKIIIIFSLIGALLVVSCQKEYSYEGGIATAGMQPANYILEGAPNACFDFRLNGNYNPGHAMTIDNNVTVWLNVTSVGSYSITTNTIDGIRFSRSGTFTSTGSQELILAATGTPEKTGTFTFQPTSSSSSCSFAVIVRNILPPSTYEFPANSDGRCSSYQMSSIYHGIPLTSENFIIVTVNVNVPGNYIISTNTVNGMTFSQAGNFTRSGPQRVLLSGRGTPVEIGVFVLTPSMMVDGTTVGKGCNLNVYVF